MQLENFLIGDYGIESNSLHCTPVLSTPNTSLMQLSIPSLGLYSVPTVSFHLPLLTSVKDDLCSCFNKSCEAGHV